MHRMRRAHHSPRHGAAKIALALALAIRRRGGRSTGCSVVAPCLTVAARNNPKSTIEVVIGGEILVEKVVLFQTNQAAPPNSLGAKSYCRSKFRRRTLTTTGRSNSCTLNRWNGLFTPDAGVPETVDGRAPPDHTISWSACIAIADGMQFNDDQGRHSELFPETSTSGQPLILRKPTWQ